MLGGSNPVASSSGRSAGWLTLRLRLHHSIEGANRRGGCAPPGPAWRERGSRSSSCRRSCTRAIPIRCRYRYRFPAGASRTSAATYGRSRACRSAPHRPRVSRCGQRHRGERTSELADPFRDPVGCTKSVWCAASRRTLHAASYRSKTFIPCILRRQHWSINSRVRIRPNLLRNYYDRSLASLRRPLIMSAIWSENR
jgi:hypothetical protein